MSEQAVQIWASVGDMSNNLEDQIVTVANHYKTTKIKALGGGGGFGNFYSVFRANFPNQRLAKQFLADVTKLTAIDAGGHYYYGSAKVTIKEQKVRVTAASFVEDLA